VPLKDNLKNSDDVTMSTCGTLTDVATTPEFPSTAYFSRAELAALLHVSPQTLKRWYSGDGRFPRPLKIGRRLLFDRAEVLAHLEQLRAADATLAD
jgi:predicted DNA-binding transcriptional regulator AlpA